MAPKTAMIFAAGLGTRLGSHTTHCPKALVPVLNRPLLEWNILNIKNFGFDKIVINVHHFSEQVIDFLAENQNFGVEIHISDERELLLETGGGLKNAASLLTGDAPFLVHNVDILSNLDLNELYQAHIEANALSTLAVSTRNTSRYLLFDQKNRLTGWENVRTGEIREARPCKHPLQFAFSGIHIIDPRIFPLITEAGKFSIIDVYLRLAQNHEIKAFEHDSSQWVDVGKPENISVAENLVHRNPELFRS